MQCNTATVLELLLSPDPVGGATTFVFQNSQQNGAGGGRGKPDCSGGSPGTCIGSQPFLIDIVVSEILTSYTLDTIGIDSPFGYMYSNCLTRSAGYGSNRETGGAYPDVILDECGPTISYNAEDYTACDDNGFAVNNDPTKYSECIFMCGIDKNKININGTNHCQDPKYVKDLVDEYLQPLGGVTPENPHLACKAVKINPNDKASCLRNFPEPVAICPCGGGADTFKASGKDQAKYEADTFVPVTVCKSGTCAGTCGSALNLVDPNGPNATTTACGGTSMPFDQCCNVSDPQSLCANTRQRHRCLKCQPKGNNNIHIDSGNGDGAYYCYYLDLNVDFRCGWNGYSKQQEEFSFGDYCGDGDYVGAGGYFDPTLEKRVKYLPGTNNQKYVRLQRDCNCDANFVEKIYPVAPICNPFIIRNPPKLEYTVIVKFRTMDGVFIAGTEMTVGSGWSPDNIEMPPILNLSPYNYTIDGFALTKILAAETETGKQSSDLHGLIVMCNNQLNAACSSSLDGDTLDDTRGTLPSTVIDVSSPDCRINPWTGEFGDNIFDPNEGKVPLPDHIYRYADRNSVTGVEKTIDRDNAAWWYFVNSRNMEDYGRGCGQIGLFPGGDSDPATANTMCNGLMGSCVPGIDTLQRGEIIDPPCNIARDFYEYLVRVNSNTEDGATACPTKPPKNPANIIPKHVPIDWNPQKPNYWVCGGRLFHQNDLNGGAINIHMTISVAADFIGEMVTQAPGFFDAEPQTCSIFLDTGAGMVTVSVENTGTQTAEYVLLAECTQGIVMANPGGVPFSVAPGSSGVTIYQQIPLGLNSTTKLTPSAEDTAAGLIVPSCNVSLYPSTLVTERFLLNKTAPIKCTVDFALIIIRPNEGPIIIPDGIGSIIPSVYGSGCSSWNLLCDFTFGRATFFSALEMMLIDMTLVFVFFAVIIWVLTNLINRNVG
jgi:hypothetical protein